MIDMYSVYDAKAKIWQYPFQAESSGAAVRAFADIANDRNHPIGQHPEDYCLYLVGSWDKLTGDVKPVEKQSFGVALEFVKADKNEFGVLSTVEDAFASTLSGKNMLNKKKGKE